MTELRDEQAIAAFERRVLYLEPCYGGIEEMPQGVLDNIWEEEQAFLSYQRTLTKPLLEPPEVLGEKLKEAWYDSCDSNESATEFANRIISLILPGLLDVERLREKIAEIITNNAGRISGLYAGPSSPWARFCQSVTREIMSLFPPDIEELLEKLRCPKCGGKKYIKIDSLHQVPPDRILDDCPTCKGTGLALHRRMVVVDMDAKLPEMLESSYGKEPYLLNPYSYNAAQQDIIDEGWVKMVGKTPHGAIE